MQVMERPGVRRETNGSVTTIILDRPERRNAVDPPTAEALRAAFRAFDRDRTARVAVLWGAGGTFCAGYDLKAFAAAPRPREPGGGEGQGARGGPAPRAPAPPLPATLGQERPAVGLRRARGAARRRVAPRARARDAVGGHWREPRRRQSLRGGRRPPRQLRVVLCEPSGGRGGSAARAARRGWKARTVSSARLRRAGGRAPPGARP